MKRMNTSMKLNELIVTTSHDSALVIVNLPSPPHTKGEEENCILPLLAYGCGNQWGEGGAWYPWRQILSLTCGQRYGIFRSIDRRTSASFDGQGRRKRSHHYLFMNTDIRKLNLKGHVCKNAFATFCVLS